MRPSQILLDTLVLLALIATVGKYRERRIRLIEAVLWSSIWLTGLVLITVPDATTVLAHALGIGRGVDVVIYLSIPFGFYLVFRLYEKIDRLNRDLTKVVRHLALSDRTPPARRSGNGIATGTERPVSGREP
jgi:hypothetical protein